MNRLAIAASAVASSREANIMARFRQGVGIIAVLLGISAFSAPAVAGPAKECSGENCMSADDPLIECKGENCLPSQENPVVECSGENCADEQPVEECAGENCSLTNGN
jgi:hypothetical protein